MAFMMPVMKNEFDIYKSRSRKVSECSNASSRKVSECRSECPSFSNDYVPSPVHRNQSMPNNRTASRPFSRTSSRTSESSLASPSKASPPKPTGGSHSSLNKFHTRLVDKLRKSLRKGRSEDRSWDEKSQTTTADATETTPTPNHHHDKSTPRKLSYPTNSTTPLIGLDDDGDSGFGNSDPLLHISRMKPPLPPAVTMTIMQDGQQRSRSRSVGTASVTTPVHRQNWLRLKHIRQHAEACSATR